MAKKYQSFEHFMLYTSKINLLCKVIETPSPLGFLAAVDFTLPLFLEYKTLTSSTGWWKENL